MNHHLSFALLTLAAACGGTTAASNTSTTGSTGTSTGGSTGSSTGATTGVATPTGPVVTVSAMAKVNKTNSAVISGTATAPSGMAAVKVDGATVTTSDAFATWTTTVTLAAAPNPTEPSINTFEVTATDQTGASIDPIPIVIKRYEDSTPPVIHAVFPSSPLLNTKTTVKARVQVADNAQVGTVTIDGHAATLDSATGQWFVEIVTPISTAPLVHDVIATDIFGNASASYPAPMKTTSTPWPTQAMALSSRGGRTFTFDSDHNTLFELSASGTFATPITTSSALQPNFGFLYDLLYTPHLGGGSGPERVLGSSSGNMVAAIDPVSGARSLIGTRPADGVAEGIELSADGTMAYVGLEPISPGLDGRIYTVSLPGGVTTLFSTITHVGSSKFKPWRLRLDAARSRLLVCNYNNDHIVAVDLTSGAVTDVVANSANGNGILGMAVVGNDLFYFRRDNKLFHVLLTNNAVTEQTFTTSNTLMQFMLDLTPFGPTANDFAGFSFYNHSFVHFTRGSGTNWAMTNDYDDGRTGTGQRLTQAFSAASVSSGGTPLVIVSDSAFGMYSVDVNGVRTKLVTTPADSQVAQLSRGSSDTELFGVSSSQLSRVDLSVSPASVTALPNGNGFGNARALAYTDGALGGSVPSVLVVRSTTPPTLSAVRLSDGVETPLATLAGNGNAAQIAVGDAGEAYVGINQVLTRIAPDGTPTAIDTPYSSDKLAWDATTHTLLLLATNGAIAEVVPSTGARTELGHALTSGVASPADVSVIATLGMISFVDPVLSAVMWFDRYTGETYVLSR